MNLDSVILQQEPYITFILFPQAATNEPTESIPGFLHLLLKIPTLKMELEEMKKSRTDQNFLWYAFK